MHYVTVKSFRLVITCAIWIGAFAIFTLHKIFSGNYYYDQNSFICTIDFPQDWIFTLFIISTMVKPAFTIITFCTFKIYAISKRHVNDINALHRQCYVFSTTNFSQFSAKNNIKDHSEITEPGSKDKETEIWLITQESLTKMSANGGQWKLTYHRHLFCGGLDSLQYNSSHNGFSWKEVYTSRRYLSNHVDSICQFILEFCGLLHNE